MFSAATARRVLSAVDRARKQSPFHVANMILRHCILLQPWHHLTPSASTVLTFAAASVLFELRGEKVPTARAFAKCEKTPGVVWYVPIHIVV